MSASMKSPQIEHAIVKLDDAICQFERATGRRYFLLLIPASQDERVHLSLDGKPVGAEPFAPSAVDVFHAALAERGAS